MRGGGLSLNVPIPIFNVCNMERSQVGGKHVYSESRQYVLAWCDGLQGEIYLLCEGERGALQAHREVG